MRKEFSIQQKFIKFNPQVIIQNYLNEDLWDKEWLVFEYRDYKFTLKLNTIWTYDRSVSIHVTGENAKLDEKHVSSFIIYLNNDTSNEMIMKRLITAVITVIEKFESNLIEETNEYKVAKKQQNENRELLKEKANKFLDEKNIENKKIREYYIDGFLKEKWTSFTYKVKKELNHNLITDIYVAWLIYANDKDKLNYFLESRPKNYDPKAIFKEMKEFKEYLETENLIQDMEESFNN